MLVEGRDCFARAKSLGASPESIDGPSWGPARARREMMDMEVGNLSRGGLE